MGRLPQLKETQIQLAGLLGGMNGRSQRFHAETLPQVGSYFLLERYCRTHGGGIGYIR